MYSTPHINIGYYKRRETKCKWQIRGTHGNCKQIIHLVKILLRLPMSPMCSLFI